MSEESEHKASGAGPSEIDTLISTKTRSISESSKSKRCHLILIDLSHINKALEKQDANPVKGIMGADILLKGKAIIDYNKKYLYLLNKKKKRMSTEDNRYSRRGVSAQKEDVHKAIKNVDKGLFPKAFCKIVPDYLSNDNDYCLVMHADGAGTKSSLAYMYWKETGDISVWKGIAQDALDHEYR